MEFELGQKKDLGLKKIVFDSLPYAIVGGATEGSLLTPIGPTATQILLNHVVPAGAQLKMLFLRVWTQTNVGCRFSIFQTNPTALSQTGTVEAFQVVGSVPAGFRDYPMLEAAGAEVLHGSLVDPIHVFEGSIIISLMGPTPVPATNARFGVSWWGLECPME